MSAPFWLPPVPGDYTTRPATSAHGGYMTKAAFIKLESLEHPVTRLSYAPGSDLLNGAALTAATWTDIHADQNFTVTSTAAFLHFAIRLGLVATSTVAVLQLGTRLLIDSGGTPIAIHLASGISEINNYAGASGADFWLSGLAAGAHMLKAQVATSQNSTVYCRASTAANYEYVEIQVIELAP